MCCVTYLLSKQIHKEKTETRTCSNIYLAERNKLVRLVSVAGEVTGVKQSPRPSSPQEACDDDPFCREFVLLPSGR